MSVFDWPPPASFGPDLRRLAESRGLVVAEIAVAQCKRCHLWGDAPAVFMDVCGGFVHEDDCPAQESDIRFIRRT